ncbi:CocE/NonD family hydrolase [Nocardia vinacea]|uniref:CocE/NonD family hydrolase n=1 Tax=Nocardia vinacea TaxID=96468 RepID=UPI000593F9BB|nr:CocE/NonD family hydrolase [Nocardia vinacea]
MSYKVSVDVLVPMRDGTKLATNIWLPDSDGPVPLLLMRGPYGKDMFAVYGAASPNIFELMKHGYGVAVQDCRGTFASEGTFDPHVADADDGADTVRWLVEQDWCDGNVGSFGGSYLGFVQWHTASTGVPGLKAIAPAMTSVDQYRAPWYSRGGALSLECVLGWSTVMSLNLARRAVGRGDGDPADMVQLAGGMADFASLTASTPVSDHPLLKKHLPWMVDVAIGHPERDETWAELSALDRVSSITTPALNIGGWYDLFYGETLRAYTEMKARAGSPEARAGQRLVMGPWSHNAAGLLGFYPDRNFGPTASLDAAQLTEAQIAFFDRWLKGREDALDDLAPVRLFVMGIDRWRDEQDWPLPDTDYTAYYLGGEGPANTGTGAGRLTTSEPTGDTTDTYLYDPRRPIPSVGGTRLNLVGYDGPLDQRPLHSRDDILCFITDVLDQPVEVTGPVTATLYVSSSAVDTDFTAKLVDVHPDGKAIILCDGIQRMRYRNSLSVPELMTPDEVYEISIDLIATSNVFLPGHRIMVEIASSNFPRYDRNSNTGGVIADEHESDMVVAVNRIHRGAEYPSRIILPIINR